jgi:hypothetical protein
VALPVEYVGLARQLRRNLIAAGAASKAAIDNVLAPLIGELARRGTMRVPTISASMRAWRLEVPAEHRVAFNVTMRGGRAHLRELLFLASQSNKPTWEPDSWEDGIVLTALRVMLAAPRKMTMEERDLSTFSLHAIGRRFQRGENASDRTADAVKRDVAALAAHDPDTMPAGDFSIPISGGWWCGQIVTIEGKRALSVRTYFDRASVPDDRLIRAPDCLREHHLSWPKFPPP